MSNEIVDDIFQSEPKSTLVEADKGKRLVNYLIDAVAISILQTILSNVFNLLDSTIFSPFFYTYKVVITIGLLSTPLYYILSEYLFEGKTLGKLVTNTRVVTLDGGRPTFNQILGRSFARIIPFEPFSYLGDSNTGWHDQMSQTIVIDEQKSNIFSQNDELV